MANDIMNRRNDMMDAMNDWFGFPRNFFDDSEIENIMQSDVAENDKDYMVKIDMPGMDKNNINVSYKDGVLNVSGSRKSFKDTSDKDHNIIHKERSEGSISRSYRLPNVVATDIHAKYDNGVLTITLPKQTAGNDGNSIQID
ncbi:Hsp20/alpha crystallin family protein [Lactobacillus kefiranofaciens subsp. kefirgranum]|uniref:Hsp20/alpha crystallin family protein n=1 Tax=Lactobacillus kefiranofaciens TaxID=267818 RepID=UPI000BA705B6|nr:Hsp20/alpha crystallin family protein [Lactobacillus kefiranofaciens]MCJ2172509.1 Hsp20/alpha crystallin family protein [Lactobacillus kefiranofaciens]MCP9331283.1 Hsp20/alpha crystallin family protein [Lactobacillus kefiranofaciens]MDF4143076.1 Hsp20/alpha crystallin family protein [Lactobacillus kefiranofaciens]PAK97872.1 heat-shock protein Hsp20 [Lactobacillus kefiranofaciens]QNT44397.1 Hsp20/alpha crystallin family protein [Lactobacillus kefiranofaciens]